MTPDLSGSEPKGLSRDLVIAVLVGASALIVCRLGSESTQYLLAQIMVWSIFALGYNIVFGMGGMLSMGHAAFFGIGSYGFGILCLSFGWSAGWAMLAAACMATALAAVFGVLVLRTSGVQLALATLALAQLVHVVMEVKLRAYSGGTDGLAGLPRPVWMGVDFIDNSHFSLLIGGFFTLALMASAVLRHSPFGRVLLASKHNAVRVAQMGYDIRVFRVAAFAISGFYAGVSGALMGSLMMFVGPDVTRWTTSGDVLIMTVLGGAGALFGPVLGVGVFDLFKEGFSRTTVHWYGLLGLVFIAITLFLPAGLHGLLVTAARWVRSPKGPAASSTAKGGAATGPTRDTAP